MTEDKTELPQDVLEASVAFIGAARKEWGDTQFKYYAIPVSWSRSGGRRSRYQHMHPVTGLDRYVISEQEWLDNVEKGKRDRMEAFMGRLRGSYTDYQRRVDVPGWREKVIELLKEREL